MNQMSTGAATPKLQAFAVQVSSGEPARLLTISVDRPPAMAIAVVLDFSDSCASASRELQKLPSLLAALPRRWPLWCYRLSSGEALGSSDCDTVGDLRDGAVDLSRFSGDRVLLDTARETSSFLRPTLEAIERRRLEAANINSVLVLIITDGELLDAAPLVPDAAITIVGVAPAVDPEKQRHWNRVLPRQKLCTLSDRTLDEFLKAGSFPFFGRCRFTWRGHDAPAIALLDSARRRLRLVSDKTWEANLAEEPVLLLLTAKHEDMLRGAVQCEPSGRGESVDLVVPLASGAASEELHEIIRVATAPSAVAGGSLRVMRAGDELFDIAAAALGDAARLAVANASWRSKDGVRIAFTEPRLAPLFVDPTGRQFDAVLVLTDTDPRTIEVPTCIVVAGMLRDDYPALSWVPAKPLDFATPVAEVQIHYDRMESRWMIRFEGCDPSELEPGGSEILGRTLLTRGSIAWHIIFSGDLA